MSRTILSAVPTWTTLALALLAAGCGTPTPSGPVNELSEAGCTALKGASIDAAQIVWPGQTSGAATVATATWHAASLMSVAERGPTPAALITPAMPAHCRVIGSSNIDNDETNLSSTSRAPSSRCFK